MKINKIVVLFFVIYLFIGVFIFKDYGIAWDEPAHRQIGYINFNYVLKGDKTLLYDTEQDHGPFIELPLVFVERALKLKDTRTIYFVRHLLNFIIFYISVIFFYFLTKKYLKNWKAGLIGCLILILSPRIFADSFYNSKDIALLSFFIISTYSLFLLIEKRSLSRIFFHAVASAALISIRALGLIMPLVTIFILFHNQVNNKSIIKYSVLTTVLTITFWPLLWTNPLRILLMFNSLAKYKYEANLPALFLGRNYSAFSLPWHYIPAWILITTPITYSILFILGVIDVLTKLTRLKRIKTTKHIFDFIVIFFAIAPILIIIALHSTLYDGWRHLFFVYPFMVMLMVKSLQKATPLLISLTIIEIVTIIIFMIRNHPYQNVYFNIFFNRNMAWVKENFELDYWGLSYRKALEYIVKTDKSTTIPLVVANNPGDSNQLILNYSDRKRLQYWSINDINKAKYFISNYRWHPDEYGYENEVFNIKIGNAKIMVVYKLK